MKLEGINKLKTLSVKDKKHETFGAYLTKCYYDVWGMKNFFKKPNRWVSKRWINMIVLQVTTAAHQKTSQNEESRSQGVGVNAQQG